MEDRTVVQPSTPGSVQPGVQLNGVYEVEQLIAYGGMGEIYRGFNIQTKEAVAIKMIRPEFASDPENFELFRREATILNSVVHDAIVRYFVFSVDPTLRRAYLAIEFVDGPSLTSQLEKGPLPPDEVRILQKRIGAALDAAHRRGIIHRDISPDNIILPEGDVRSAKVIDFGIARALKRADASIIGGRFAGKYNYASPEQFGLAGGDVTAKSDIYSFGLVLAAALRGRPIDMNGTEVETIGKRAATPDLSGIDPSFRPLLEAMLQPLPANRPASMADVAVWEPPPIAPPRSAKALIAPPTREGGGGGRAAAIAAAAIVVLSLGGLAYVFRDALAGRAGPAEKPAAASSETPTKESPQTNAGPAVDAAKTAPAAGSSPPPLTPAAPQLTPAAPPPLTPAALPVARDASQAEQPAPQAQVAPPHVVTADELVAAVQRHAAEHAPVVQASPSPAPPAEPVQLAKPVPIVQPAVEPPPAVAEKPAAPVAKAAPPPPQPQNPVPSPSPVTPVVAAPPPAVIAKPDGQPASTPEPVKVAKLEPQPPPAAPVDPAKAFVAGFEGGDCFFVTPRAGATAPNAYQAAGIDIGPFQRFDAGFKQAVGAEADINVALIAPPECPALDLARLGATDGAGAPRIELTRDEVGRGKPLAGKIANLAGRRLYLLLAKSDGTAARIDVKPQPDGQAATFSAALTPEAAAIGPMQVLLAIASDKPLPALESFRSGPLKAIAAKVADEAREAAASAGAGYFKFIN